MINRFVFVAASSTLVLLRTIIIIIIIIVYSKVFPMELEGQQVSSGLLDSP